MPDEIEGVSEEPVLVDEEAQLARIDRADGTVEFVRVMPQPATLTEAP